MILAVFWEWSNRDIPEGAWYYIVSRDWTARLITLCSAVIRTCISAQAITCSMMLASLILEHPEIPAKDIPIMSVYQYANSGPLEITLPLLHALRKTGLFKIPTKLLTVTLLVFTSTMSQFISTFLLSDLKAATVFGSIEMRPLPYRRLSAPPYSKSPGTVKSNMFFSRAIEYPLFAEDSTESFQITGNKTISGVKDSGRVIRAHLPLLQSERASLAQYHGPAVLMGSHFLCSAAVLTNIRGKALRFHNPGPVAYSDSLINPAAGFSISANVSAPYPNQQYEKLKDRDWYNFTIPRVNGTVNSDSCTLSYDALSVCWVDIGPTNDTEHFYEFPIEGYNNINTQWYLVLNTSWERTLDHLLFDPIINGYTIESELDGSEWTKLTLPGDKNNTITITSSICFASLSEVASNITVETVAPILSEPVLRLNVDNTTYNTTAIQNQLGIGTKHTSYRERGIFELSEWNQNVEQFRTYISPWAELCIPIGGSCDIKGGIDNALATVFQDTLLLTDNLAIAMQALFAIAYSIAFENTKLFFTHTSDAEMRFFKSHSIPRQYTGFSIVVGILSIHSLLLASIIWRFLGSQSLEGARPVLDPSSSIERTDTSDSTNSTTLNEEYIPLQSLLEQEGSVFRSTARGSRISNTHSEVCTYSKRFRT